jgi:membrane protein DedA with SNARE-associated domain
VQALQHYFALYGYAALLPLAIVEGPAVTVLAGILAAQGVLDLAIMYPIVVVGDLIGDLAYYAVGHWLPRVVSFHAWRWTRRISERAAAMAPLVRANAGKMLIIGKLTHSAGFAVLLAAGAVRVPLPRFLSANFLGTAVKSLVLLMIGYFFARLWSSLQADFGLLGATGLVIAVLALLVVWRRFFDADRRSA